MLSEQQQDLRDSHIGEVVVVQNILILFKIYKLKTKFYRKSGVVSLCNINVANSFRLSNISCRLCPPVVVGPCTHSYC